MSEGATISAPARACDSADGRQPFERGVVIHFAVHDLAAMPVARVFAIANVGHDQQIRHFSLDSANRTLHDSVIVVSARSLFVLRLRQPEQNHTADIQTPRLLAFFDCRIDRQLAMRRHRADRLPNAFARANEQRQNKVGGLKPRLPDHPANRFSRPQTARSVYWKRHLNGFYRPAGCGKITIPRETARQTPCHGFIICGIESSAYRATEPAPQNLFAVRIVVEHP